jgi:iron-sulfur cluster repair protein YtfE (RIC family)
MTLPGLDELSAQIQQALGNVDPTAYLIADHNWLRSVLAAYRGQVAVDSEREQVVTDVEALQNAIDVHIRKEEEAYFPAIEGAMEELGQGSTFDMYGEHDAIRIRLEELLQALSDGSGIQDAFGALTRSLTVHFENEEELIFAEAPAHLSIDQRQTILEQFGQLH